MAAENRRILMRMGKSPFQPMSLERSEDINVTGSNSGNMLFAQSVFKTLSAPGVTIGRQGYVAKPKHADAISEKYDTVVLPMANALRNEWVAKLNAYTTMVRQLKVPVVVTGIGVQTDLDYDLGKLAPVDEAAKAFVGAVLDKSATIGVRGECTAAYLKRLGFGADVVRIIGCPSLYSYGGKLDLDIDKSRELTPASKISINVTSAFKKQTFREGLELMLQIADRHVQRYPNAIVVPQEARALSTMIWGEFLKKGTDYDGLSQASLDALAAGRAKFFVDPLTWYRALSQCQFSFGTRLHGNIAALLGGTPAVMFATDSRTRELGEFFHIPWKRIDTLDADVDAANLAREADYSALLKALPSHFDNYIAFIKENGLPSLYDHPAEAAAFDQRLAAVQFCPAASGVPSNPFLPLKHQLKPLAKKVRRVGNKLRKAA